MLTKEAGQRRYGNLANVPQAPQQVSRVTCDLRSLLQCCCVPFAGTEDALQGRNCYPCGGGVSLGVKQCPVLGTATAYRQPVPFSFPAAGAERQRPTAPTVAAVQPGTGCSDSQKQRACRGPTGRRQSCNSAGDSFPTRVTQRATHCRRS